MKPPIPTYIGFQPKTNYYLIFIPLFLIAGAIALNYYLKQDDKKNR